MNNARLEELERSLTGIARKVLGVVPTSTEWFAKEIHSELSRTGTSIERRVVDGCLTSLIASGLVREPAPGKFIRVGPKPVITPAAEAREMSRTLILAAAASPEPAPTPREPLDVLAEAAASMRAFGKSFSDLAVQIEEAAVAIEERAEVSAADAAKLRQLQTLLKSLT